MPPKQTGPPLNVISDVNISVIDVNEPPDDIRLVPENVTIPENVSIGYCIAQVTSKNPERRQRVDYTLLNYQNTFAIKDKCANDSSGVSDGKRDLSYLTVKSHLSYDDYMVRGYKILIEAEDNGIPPQSFNGTVEVHVTKIDPCPSSACHEDATCSRVDWQNYTCACKEGYTGNGFNCSEIDECQSHPCSFGGTCHNYVNYYNCTCPRGYHNGTDCTQIQFCQSSPCQHDATCENVLNGYYCFCTAGYTGVHCETDIDDCAREPCAEGSCLDGINSFTCNCSGTGFFGTNCQRKLGACTEEPCENQEICIPPNVEKYNSVQCLSPDYVVSLSFPEGENTSSPQWQNQLELVISGLTFPMTEVTNDEYDSTSVNVEDVFIIRPSLEHASKARRSAPEESPSVDFIVIVKSDTKLVGVPVKTVLCGINNTCVTNSYTPGSAEDFNNKLCKSTADRIEYLGILNCVAREAKDLPQKNQRHSSNMRLYYVTGGIGGLLLMVIVIGLLLCRRNTLSQKERRIIKQERFRHNDDETYTDIMYRHHMAKQEVENAGAFNPIYGNAEQEVGTQVTMLDNPIYQEPEGHRPVRRSESTTGFENPMYSSFKREKQDDESEVEEKDKVAKATGFANPMFTSYRQVRNEVLTAKGANV